VKVRAVFFDFGGTLGSLDPVIDSPWKAWVMAAQSLNIDLAPSEIRKANEEANRHFDGQIYRFHGRTEEFWRVRDMWVIERLGVTSGREKLFDALQQIFGDPARVQLYPETVQVLQHARQETQHMGVISNFTDALLKILAYHQLSPYFDSVTYSQEVGFAKPDIRVFRAALVRAGCRPDQTVHIGDSWESDYEGALNAGLGAVWLNRTERQAPRPCREIKSLTGLLPILASE
jgi:HAD superfamily hydrolase (TIGR01549 family)